MRLEWRDMMYCFYAIFDNSNGIRCVL